MGRPRSSGSAPRWGFHQLADGWAQRLVRDAHLGAGDLVLDVGAGLGALTRPLLATGAKVVAIELHRGRARILEERLGHPRLTVVRADAGDLRLPRRPFSVVANPPFDANTALLRRLLSAWSQLAAAHLVLPHRTALRWADGRAPGAARWMAEWDLRVGPTVPRRAFRPAAPGEYRVLRITRRYGPAGGSGGARRGR